MRDGIHEPVSVIAGYSHKQKKFRPLIVTWGAIDYHLGKIDFYHKTKQGTTVLHHFSLSDIQEQVYFKLQFNATSLNWTLEEYMAAGESAPHYN